MNELEYWDHHLGVQGGALMFRGVLQGGRLFFEPFIQRGKQCPVARQKTGKGTRFLCQTKSKKSQLVSRQWGYHRVRGRQRPTRSRKRSLITAKELVLILLWREQSTISSERKRRGCDIHRKSRNRRRRACGKRVYIREIETRHRELKKRAQRGEEWCAKGGIRQKKKEKGTTAFKYTVTGNEHFHNSRHGRRH